MASEVFNSGERLDFGIEQFVSTVVDPYIWYERALRALDVLLFALVGSAFVQPRSDCGLLLILIGIGKLFIWTRDIKWRKAGQFRRQQNKVRSMEPLVAAAPLSKPVSVAIAVCAVIAAVFVYSFVVFAKTPIGPFLVTIIGLTVIELTFYRRYFLTPEKYLENRLEGVSEDNGEFSLS